VNNIIELNKLQKHFKPDTVLMGVDLCLKEHSVLGLLGVNGAGKTTLIRCALGLLKPSMGEAKIFGHSAWDMPPEVKAKIGFVSQTPDLFYWMSAEQMLAYTGAFYKNWNEKKVRHLLNEWDIVGCMRISKMSEGQKQRLAIVLAMGHDPDLLVLDEPVAALDPVGRRSFVRQLIELNVDEGKTILFSTHIVSDLERIAAEVAIMRDGRVHFQGEIDSLKESVVKLHIHSTNTLPVHIDLPNILSCRISGNTASICLQEYKPEYAERICKQYNASTEVQQMGLEDIFLEINQ
jgi:ABC-2 type transport system ATP-binding protein